MITKYYVAMYDNNTSFLFQTFLQMSNDNPFVIPEMDPSLRTQVQECNWQVVNVTTPANYFHVLRRQVRFLCFCFFCEGKGAG